MMDKNLRATSKRVLLASILVSVLFVVSIPCIPIFFVLASGADSFKGLFLGLGISFSVIAFLCFYAVTFVWVYYGSYAVKLRVYDAIIQDNIYTVNELVKYYALTNKVAVETIQWLLNKGYLKGYLFDGHTLSLNEHRRMTHREVKVIINDCPHCGGKEYKKTDSGYVCAYCGAKVDITTIDR